MITRINWARARSALAALLTSGSLALAPGAPAQAAGPVSTRSFTAMDGAYTFGTYPDGSIAVARVEAPDASARSITGCSVSGNIYSDCKIEMWVGVVQLAFRASYDLSTNQVTSAYGAEYTIFGACGASSGIDRPAGNVARLNVRAQICGLPDTPVLWLQLTIRDGSAHVGWSDGQVGAVSLWNTFVAIGFGLTVGVIIVVAIWLRRRTWI